MSLTRKLIIGAAGFAAFIVACAGAATLQMIMGGLIQSNSPDPPGALEPSPEEKAKKEWEATQKTKSDQPSSAGSQETVTPSGANESSTQSQPEPPVRSPELPTANVPPSPPAPPLTGPGNFDGFSAPQRNFSGTTGPGNM